MQDCHKQAWASVQRYMDSNLSVFAGSSAESTIMPALSAWISESLGEIAEVRDANDHAIVGWLCLPTAGVISAVKWDFFITLTCNLLAQHRKNGVVFIIHSNRAAQISRIHICTKFHTVILYNRKIKNHIILCYN